MATIITQGTVGDDHHHHHHHGVSTRAPISASSSLSSLVAAHEVLGLLGYVLDMWSRHKDSLRVLACGGDMREEEVGVVERLGSELRELWEEVVVVAEGSSSSVSEASSVADKEEDENDAVAGLSEVSGNRIGCWF